MTEVQRKEFLDIMLAGYELQQAVKKAYADGEVNIMDVQYLPAVAGALYQSVKGFDQVVEGWKNLTEEDKEYFAEKMRELLDLPDDVLEQWIEDLFEWAVHTVLLVKRGIDIITPEEK